jgi:hypothetical protein
METIRINGVDVPVEAIEGPSDEDLSAAYRRKSQEMRSTRCSLNGFQSSGSKFVGTPRLQKHKGGSVMGVRIK